MPVSFIANALGGTTTTTSFSITLPTTQAGDILILEFAHRGTGDGTIGGTSGLTWAQKHSQLFGGLTFSGKTRWARATGDHAGQTVTGSGLTDSCAAILTVYRGAKASGDPLAAATIVGEQNASGNETQAQIVTTVDGAWVALTIAGSPDAVKSSQGCTSPGALVERAERLSTGGTDTSISHASAEKATAGATGSFIWTTSNTVSGSWAYAIEPEPPADTTDELGAADGIDAGAPTLGTPALGQSHALTASGLSAGTPVLDTTAVGQVHALTASGVDADAPTLGAPALAEETPTDDLVADGIDAGTTTLGSPAIGQVHDLAMSGLSAGEVTIGTPGLGQIHSLSGSAITTGTPALGAPSIGQTHALLTQGLATGAPTLGSPALDGVDSGTSCKRTAIRIGTRIGL